ncbi:hypothetical protein FHW67_000921 [Herbaspirillum sp. Sphag1AN]|uniref:hypothetical protein n=1 Tax=unclassified Herbaspirillum TaxID=2624150 RepID=UPI00161FE789|nr:MULTISPECIES: hypothetical protein [unclassified Herbaspirillum]MBB3211673.1 hypothetical protein [Herbaspirillum sp. Sphag1AN]MBB3245059.1 hypothetical protein [Herbaspirillum sp. Sphag64]
MIFYHFTTAVGAREIVRTSEIQLGRLPAFEKELSARSGVSLTTSDQPDGHGLPDGRKVSDQEFQYLLKNAPANFALDPDGNGGYFCVDHTEVRLEIDIPDALWGEYRVKRVIDSYDPIQLLAMDVTAHFPLGVYSDEEMLETIESLHTGRLVAKSPTWWWSEKAIPISMIKTAAIKFQGQYQVLLAEEFIAEVRASLAD